MIDAVKAQNSPQVEETVVKQKQIAYRSANTLERNPEEDSYKRGLDTGAKLGIGATFLTVLAMTIAGFRGKAMLEAAKQETGIWKSIKVGAKNFFKSKENAVKNLIENMTLKDLSNKEFKNIIDSIPEDAPVLKDVLSKIRSNPELCSKIPAKYLSKENITKFTNMPVISEFLSKDSILKKPLKDLDLKTIKQNVNESIEPIGEELGLPGVTKLCEGIAKYFNELLGDNITETCANFEKYRIKLDIDKNIVDNFFDLLSKAKKS